MNFFRRTEVAPASPPSTTLGRSDTIPADQGSMTDRLSTGANAMIDKATEVYNKNPKLIGGLAAVAGAILLTRMKRGRN